MNPGTNQNIPLGINSKNGIPYRVIIVDDSGMMRKLLSQYLRSENFEVSEMENGDMVINKYSELNPKPDFIFLDVVMPGTDGVETLRQLKKLDSNVKVIMITSNTDKDLVRELIQIGIVGFVVKPFKRDDVLIRIAKILGRQDWDYI